MKEIRILLTDETLEIVDHFAKVFGFTREEAAQNFLLTDARYWYTKVMAPEGREMQGEIP